MLICSRPESNRPNVQHTSNQYTNIKTATAAMSARPPRSASIPIPRTAAASSSARNIESVISIPFTSSGRTRITARELVGEDRRGDARRPSTSYTIEPTPTRSLPTRSAARAPTFEPRVVRADCTSSPPTNPYGTSAMRRTSSSSARPPTGIHRHGSVASVPSSGPSAPVTFPRPAYLDNSALRDRLQTEQYTALPQRRTLERAAPTDTRAHVRAYGAMSPFSDSDDDSTASLSRSEYGYIGGRSTTTAKPPAPPIIPADEVLKLPSRWSEQMRHPLLTVSPDGRDLSYEGVSCSGDRDAAAARTINPIPPACGIYYYEVTILSKGQKGHISIGFTGKDVKLARLPGWEPHSWGYHGDDGCSFAAEKSGTPYGPVFGTGDVIGCGIDFTINRAFYTKNGSFIGHVFDNIGKTCALYPSVGLRHAGEMVRVNFGHEAFRFDIEYHVQQQKAAVWGRIVGTAVDAGVLVRGVKQEAMGIKQEAAERDVRGIERDVRGIEQGIKQEAAEGDVRGALQGLVMSYLAHHGYARTTRALRTQAAGKVGEGAVGGASVGAGASAKPDADMHVGTGSEYVGTGSEYVGTDTDTDVEAANTDIEDADIARRTAIVGAVTAGDIDRAIAQTRAHYGAVLEDEDGLMLFKLPWRRKTTRTMRWTSTMPSCPLPSTAAVAAPPSRPRARTGRPRARTSRPPARTSGRCRRRCSTAARCGTTTSTTRDRRCARSPSARSASSRSTTRSRPAGLRRRPRGTARGWRWAMS